MKKTGIERNDDFCKQYIKMDWDGCEAVEYFARFQEHDPENKYSNKPNNELFTGLRDTHIGVVHAYNVVIPAYVKEEVVERLEKCLSAPVQVPGTVVSVSTYQDAFIKQVTEILSKIKANDYPFQKGRRMKEND